jgi:hypothetical protein
MLRLARFLPPFALALGLGACGGTDEGRPDDTLPTVVPLDPCEHEAAFEFQNIVDFDPPEGEMPPSVRFQNCDPANRCTFNYNLDVANQPGNPAATGDCPDVPVYTNPIAMAEALIGTDAGTRCGRAEYATRLTMTNLAVCTNDQGRQGWGGSLSMTFSTLSGGVQPFDASEFDGFSFWVKKASAATRSALIATAVDPYTAGTRNIEDPFGGDPRSCDASGATVDAAGNPIPDTEKCDGFGVAVTLADDWTFIPVRFAAMRQKGFGMPSPLGHVLTEELVRLQFLISAGDWDVWIDDVSFFREPDP